MNVFLAGIDMISSVTSLISLVLFPVKMMHFIPILFANSNPLITFLLFPEVEIAIATSPFLPNASSCLEKSCSKPKSLPIAESVDVSVTKDNAGIDFLFLENLTVNSVDKC